METPTYIALVATNGLARPDGGGGEQPRQRQHPGLQGRNDADVGSRASGRDGHRAVLCPGLRHRPRLLARHRCARPATTSTSRSRATASSPSRPRRACATPGSAASSSTQDGMLVTSHGYPVLAGGGSDHPRSRRRPGQCRPRTAAISTDLATGRPAAAGGRQARRGRFPEPRRADAGRRQPVRRRHAAADPGHRQGRSRACSKIRTSTRSWR